MATKLRKIATPWNLPHGEDFSKACTTARRAICIELKRRFKHGRETSGVRLAKDTSRWHHPQLNYFCGEGTMKCPICPNGILTYRRDDYAGHVSGYCSTSECVNWLE